MCKRPCIFHVYIPGVSITRFDTRTLVGLSFQNISHVSSHESKIDTELKSLLNACVSAWVRTRSHACKHARVYIGWCATRWLARQKVHPPRIQTQNGFDCGRGHDSYTLTWVRWLFQKVHIGSVLLNMWCVLYGNHLIQASLARAIIREGRRAVFF